MNSLKTFCKKYWWILLPLPLIALYWYIKHNQPQPVHPGTVGASQAETGNPASDANNPGNQPGGTNNPS
jgi:hypothetical protein